MPDYRRVHEEATEILIKQPSLSERLLNLWRKLRQNSSFFFSKLAASVVGLIPVYIAFGCAGICAYYAIEFRLWLLILPPSFLFGLGFWWAVHILSEIWREPL